MPPPGIENTGAACFIISSLQVFFNIPEFNENLQELINNNDFIYNYYRSYLIYKQAKKPINVNDLFAIFNEKFEKRRIVSTAQSDANEFIDAFLELLQKETKKEVSINVVGTIRDEEENKKQDNLAVSAYGAIKSTYENFNEYGYSPLVDGLFNGIEISKNTKLDGSISYKAAIFKTISIQVIDENNKNIIDNIFKYTAKETLDNGEEKELSFWSLPKILILHLKLFDSKMVDGEIKINKIKNKSNITIDLDMKQFVVGYEHEKYQYELIGIIYHMGSNQSGHYIADIKYQDGLWYNVNDSIVSELNPQPINFFPPTKNINANSGTNEFDAYIMFYRMKEPASEPETAEPVS